ncbi:MAG: DUF1156 domain-containing protein [Chloroherpetonaceae bacterium]|nr:DUF1156 domain-containing protein [Chloroherpetonaceae bacterium]
MPEPKKLIEVALPIQEISAESVRDKSIRHGHISTLHLWWARRPLPVCRAVVFASLVPDPDDEYCPTPFREAVSNLLDERYKPNQATPDTRRNRLLAFIGKFSDTYLKNEDIGKTTPPKKTLSENSLIKWENKNNEQILTLARKLIFVAYQATLPENRDTPFSQLSTQFDSLYSAIKTVEKALYDIPNRHINTPEIAKKENDLHQAIEVFLNAMPSVFDPFAGGGAIPLEAARLGCRSYGNDLNPVAHIIQKGSLEYPQKYGKPITFTKSEFIARYGEKEWHVQNPDFPDNPTITIPNRLAFDVEFFAKKLLAKTEAEIGHYYPTVNGKKPIAYYWARVATCANPTCGAKVPLLKQFYLVNTKTKHIYLKPNIEGKSISFDIVQGKYDEKKLEGWNNRGNLKCPICNSVTDVVKIKDQSIQGKLEEVILSVIEEGENGKSYRKSTMLEQAIVKEIPNVSPPNEKMQRNSAGGDTFSWGISEWGQLFSPRQLLALQTLVKHHHSLCDELNAKTDDYGKAIAAYLAILIDRVSIINTTFGRLNIRRETLEHPFSKQAIPMIFDYPESNPFCNATGSALNQLEWITRYIESESQISIWSNLKQASSGEKSQFPEKSLTAVITDPPYYDAIAYADLSDFFYVWLKRTLGEVFPENFATPQTPKMEECTALKHHRNGSEEDAKTHFETKLRQIFDALEHQTRDIVSIMFAHQSTEAWTTLCNSILGARMNITGSWAIDSEMQNRSLALAGNVLESSITVPCKPSSRVGVGSYQEVRGFIEKRIQKEVNELFALGFRGADLLTACFGQAVSEFGKYERVEKGDGSVVSVAELLDLAKESAFNALVKGFEGDDYTKFYISWLQLYGFSASDFDDITKLARVGLNIDAKDLVSAGILPKTTFKPATKPKDDDNDKEEQNNRPPRKKTGETIHKLGTCLERFRAFPTLGTRNEEPLINMAHRVMALYQSQDRAALLSYLASVTESSNGTVWRVLNSLGEVLPKGTEDAKWVVDLLLQRDSLMREVKALRSKANDRDPDNQGFLFN